MNPLDVAPFLWCRDASSAWIQIGDVLQVHCLKQVRGTGLVVVKVTPRSTAGRWLNDWTATSLPRGLGIVSQGRWIELVGARVRPPEDAEPELWLDAEKITIAEDLAELNDDAYLAVSALGGERCAARRSRRSAMD